MKHPMHKKPATSAIKRKAAGWSRTGKLVLMSLMAAALVACGGGGASPSVSGDIGAVVQGTVQSGVLVPTATEAATVSVTTSADSQGIVISNLTGALSAVRNGQIVVLPASDTQGIPLGFTGKASVQADGSVLLAEAQIGDLFKTLKVDFDTARDGGTVAGLIVPKNGKMNASINEPASMQTGIERVSCQTGLAAIVDIKCKNGELEGSITLEHPIMVKKKGTSEQAAAKLYATIDLTKLTAKYVADFDEVQHASTGGFKEIKSEIKGEWGMSMGIKIDDDAVKAEIPAWSELIRSDEANIWDENTKVKFGKYFELSGLNGDDKKGLIPLGGIYLTPANFAAGGQGFGGELTAAQLGQIKGAGIIFWFYLDFSGNLTVSGDFKFAELTGGEFNRGFKLEAVNDKLVSTIINTKTQPNVFAPRLKGKIEATQTVGAAVALDVLVAGIRPATVKSTLLGFQATGTLEGDGGYRWSPQPTGLQGNICVSSNKKLFTDIMLRAAVNGKMEVGWLSVKGGLEYEYKPEPYIWWEDNAGACVNTFTLPLTQVSSSADPAVANNTKVEMSFASAYNDASLRAQVGRWQIFEEGPLQTRFYDADISFGGLFTVSLAPGAYKFTVLALHKDIKDGANELVVVRSQPVTVNVSALPKADFTAELVNNDCKKLKITSTASAGAGATLDNYKWVVTPTGGNAQTQQGAAMSSLTFTLAACGNVSVAHTVTDSQGRTALSTRNLDTQALAPRVIAISPTVATVNQAVTLMVTGANLPRTVVLAMADATCAAPTGVSSSAFSVVCTPQTTGSKLITVKTNTQINNGLVIDDTRSVSVSSATTTTAKPPHSGITASQCYAAGSNALVDCSTSVATSLNNLQDGHRTGVNAMSYTKVSSTGAELAASATTWCAVRDNITGHLWQNHQSTPAIYTNYGDNSAGDASKYAADNATLCGLSGWRLPTVDELQTIVDYSKPYPGPTINTTWFLNTPSYSWYWASSPYVGDSGSAWYVYFGDGDVGYYYRVYNHQVRLVRASQ